MGISIQYQRLKLTCNWVQTFHHYLKHCRLFNLSAGLFTLALLTGCSTMTQDESFLSYGAFVHEEGTTFKLLAPKADQVLLVIFPDPAASRGTEHSMRRDKDGIWTLMLEDAGVGTLYGYRLQGEPEWMDSTVIVADPYSKAAVTQNSWRHVAKTLIIDTSYDWGDDTLIKIDPRDLTIYEMHVRDMTIHTTSTLDDHLKGTYPGLVAENQNGGIQHLKDMGINAVQILPLQDFANMEIPYKDKSTPMVNTWNPYARNHWGYMTTFFFAPESYYATDGTAEPGAWNGTDGRAVRELKDMVREFHRHDIAVIMDVVYNHVSNYDWHPLKYIDKEMYFRLTGEGDWIAESGCGNDTKSESPAMRQLILESLKYWMTEYHVDGFRFDLGYLIDETTRTQIIEELRAINPQVIILAEPWGGGYDPDGFSDQGWASFNDQFRNGVKGQNPHDGLGFVFGEWWGDTDQEILQRFVMGSLREYGGQYLDPAHSVNYLESHDDHTYGDFIRIGTDQAEENEIIVSRLDNARVKGYQLALNKLGALFLFTSQGITFMHEGQEWARSKVIARSNVPDPRTGMIDHNSYNKDNNTNWLNWNERDINPELVNYYQGLIQLRKSYPEFRRSSPEDFEFLDTGKQVALAYRLTDRFIVALNGDPNRPLPLKLPAGVWQVLADKSAVYPEGKQTVQDKISVPKTSGMVLQKM